MTAQPLGTGRLAVRGASGAAATAHPLATRAAMDALRAGGNAVDAAIAAGAVMNVVEPQNSHMGGDAFFLIWDAPSGRVHAVNASGHAPEGARPVTYDDQIPLRGWRSTTVPGQLAGWDLARRLFGSRPMGELLGPAIALAANGFPVGRRLARAIDAHKDALAACPAARSLFLPDGAPLRAGSRFVQSDFAQTLRALAIGGPRELYEFGLAEAVADAFAANGGDLSLSDLYGYGPEILDPLSADWRGCTVYVQPPVSQAHVMLEALLIVEPFVDECTGPVDPEWVHVCVEAIKLAYADRFAYAGDLPPGQFPVEQLLSPGYVATRRSALLRNRAQTPAAGAPGDSDTTQIVTADASGGVVCLIQSLFHPFGCGVVIDGLGILMNNRLTGFDLDPTHPNALEPGKRPMHTLTTYLATRDGKPVLVGGTPGGMKQVQTNLQTLTAVLAFGDDPQTAVERPRWHWNEDLWVSLEETFGHEVLESLARRGHEVESLEAWGAGGSAEVIAVEPDGFYAAGSDPRSDGCAEAF